jgi:hypothetical protein
VSEFCSCSFGDPDILAGLFGRVLTGLPPLNGSEVSRTSLLPSKVFKAGEMLNYVCIMEFILGFQITEVDN